MILVDTALEKRLTEDNPIRVGLVGAGFSGRMIAQQIVTSVPGLRLVAIANRSLDRARAAYASSGETSVATIDQPHALDRAVEQRQYAVTTDARVVYEAQSVEAIIETTGTVDHAATVVLGALEAGKHVVLVNAELDSTLGPILNAKAREKNVVYTNTDGDEPGVAMNMLRFVRSIGLEPVVVGNLKGFYDRYRNPETQREFADRVDQDAGKIASFADGTKLSMELCVLANATGLGVPETGMYGPALPHVNDSPAFFGAKVTRAGFVDYLVGAEPGSGAFVLGRTGNREIASYLKYLKMGEGPLYVFYRPFHLPQLEAPLTVARAVLFRDAAVRPLGGPVCEAVAVAKRDLREGDVLDGLGGFACYGQLENCETSIGENLLPVGLMSGRRLRRPVAKDVRLSYDDLHEEEPSLSDRLRRRQVSMLSRSTDRDPGTDRHARR